ncbi:hypothetical protein ACIQW5_29345 [Methylorubrum thiocyanatum]|uniref:hypothetical protein n=1 Tax=Methylorubrum thiocyanatum TaxID=47958 RepID=UPI00383B6F8F
MTGFYRVDYQGVSGIGAGGMALANGKVAGIDIGGGIYRGTYVIEAGRIRGTAILSFENGGRLVTGAQVPPGTEIPIPFDLEDSGNTHVISVSVAGRAVNVRLAKIAEL